MKQQISQPLNCLIIDDKNAVHKTIKLYISKVPWIDFSGSCMNAVRALEQIASSDYDLIFLDMDMPYILGPELLTIARDISESVVITTANPKFAIDFFEPNVADLLLKPISFDRFLKAVHEVRIQRQTKNSQQESLISEQHSDSSLPRFQLLKKRMRLEKSIGLQSTLLFSGKRLCGYILIKRSVCCL